MRWGYLRQLLLVPGCIFLLCPAYSQAQWRGFGSSVDNRLNPDDLKALNAAARSLLDRPQLAEGGFEAWSSTRSGVSGTIIAGKPLSRSGMDCRVLNFFTHVPGPNADRDRDRWGDWGVTPGDPVAAPLRMVQRGPVVDRPQASRRSSHGVFCWVGRVVGRDRHLHCR